MESVEDVIVVGIDFGTTYSGVSWATYKEFTSNKVNVITRWPGIALEEPKTPTEISYGTNGEVSWGSNIDPNSDVIRWFKLLLIPEAEMSIDMKSNESIMHARSLLKTLKKTTTDVITDYFRELWKHIQSTMIREKGQSTIDSKRFHIVMTIPAIWSTAARIQMSVALRNCGALETRDAGDTTISFVPEPEAAAIATLSEPGRSFKPKDTIIICDCGGGTVDLITYQVEQEKPLVLKEFVEGTGGLYGAFLVDSVFIAAAKRTLGDRWTSLTLAGQKSLLSTDWDSVIKRTFTERSPTRTYKVGVPAEAFAHHSLTERNQGRTPYIMNGQLFFSKDDIAEFFKASISGILDLVEQQYNWAVTKGQKPRAIVLVGGFGGSFHIFDKLRGVYAPRLVEVIQGSGFALRTSICRGASMKGFLTGAGLPSSSSGLSPPVSISSTISRVSFGIEYHTNFVLGVHLEEDKIWDPRYLRSRARKQMEWYLLKGQDVSTVHPKKKAFVRLLEPSSSRSQDLSLGLCECAVSPAPSRRTSAVLHSFDISASIERTFNELPKYTNRLGQVFAEVHFEVALIPSGTSVEFVVYFEGRPIAHGFPQLRLD